MSATISDNKNREKANHFIHRKISQTPFGYKWFLSHGPKINIYLPPISFRFSSNFF
jgi:hypothetical protein